MFDLTKIDPWFLIQIEEIIMLEKKLSGHTLSDLTKEELYYLKQKGFADARIAELLKPSVSESAVAKRRDKFNLHPVYKRIDTCAAEFDTDTAYFYSTYQSEDESRPSARDKIIILGGGPNRIGQGIEFDYCCVHAALAMREMGFETIMVNCNPETVSTDFHISDRLYFESVTLEDVLEIVRVEKPKGMIVQFGGQTPLKLARALEEAGVPMIGTTPDSIEFSRRSRTFPKNYSQIKIKAACQWHGALQRRRFAFGKSVQVSACCASFVCAWWT